MIDPDKGRVRDDVERLLAAIVRMRPPADVGQQAGGVTIAPLVRGLIEAGARHESVGPSDQLVAVHRRTRAQQIEVLRGRDQRVLGALLRLEQRVEQPFAHAERRDDDLLRLHQAHRVLEHQRRIG